MVALQQGKLDKATQLLEDGLAAARKVGHQPEVAQALHQLGLAAALQGRTVQAEHYLREALAIWLALENEPRLAELWRTRGRVAADSGESVRYYPNALQLAVKHDLAPVALAVLTDVMPFLPSAGQSQYAATLVTLAARHPASSLMMRAVAREQLDHLAGDVKMPAVESGQLPDWHEHGKALAGRVGRDRAGPAARRLIGFHKVL